MVVAIALPHSPSSALTSCQCGVMVFFLPAAAFFLAAAGGGAATSAGAASVSAALVLLDGLDGVTGWRNSGDEYLDSVGAREVVLTSSEGRLRQAKALGLRLRG